MHETLEVTSSGKGGYRVGFDRRVECFLRCALEKQIEVRSDHPDRVVEPEAARQITVKRSGVQIAPLQRLSGKVVRLDVDCLQATREAIGTFIGSVLLPGSLRSSCA